MSELDAKRAPSLVATAVPKLVEGLKADVSLLIICVVYRFMHDPAVFGLNCRLRSHSLGLACVIHHLPCGSTTRPLFCCL